MHRSSRLNPGPTGGPHRMIPARHDQKVMVEPVELFFLGLQFTA